MFYSANNLIFCSIAFEKAQGRSDSTPGELKIATTYLPFSIGARIEASDVLSTHNGLPTNHFLISQLAMANTIITQTLRSQRLQDLHRERILRVQDESTLQ